MSEEIDHSLVLLSFLLDVADFLRDRLKSLLVVGVLCLKLWEYIRLNTTLLPIGTHKISYLAASLQRPVVVTSSRGSLGKLGKVCCWL